MSTHSCWQSRRVVNVGERKQCGFCAACLLRRVGLHAAGVNEARDAYVVSDLAATDAGGALSAIPLQADRNIMVEYGSVGARHLQHLAELADLPDDAAQVIGMSRPRLVSIEKGVHRVRVQEIQMLARHYGVSVNALLRREALHTDLMPRFRKLRETEDAHTTEATLLFNDLIKVDVEMESILGIQRRRNYPPARGINDGDVVALAEKHVKELRDWLGLGPGPIADIFSVIELSFGIRLYQPRLSSSSKVAGLFTYDERHRRLHSSQRQPSIATSHPIRGS